MGKDAISDLTEQEKERIQKILSDVGLNNEDILEQLASRNYNQFSTGQQKRLVFAQTLYRVNRQISVLLMDEPAGNVEKELIEEIFGMVKQYTKNNGIITILCTHRDDLVMKYIDKHYHLGGDGVVREIENKIQGDEEEELC